MWRELRRLGLTSGDRAQDGQSNGLLGQPPKKKKPFSLKRLFALSAPPSSKPRTIVLNETPSQRRKSPHPPNIVKNQKYNLVTFLPLVLYQQFKFFYNLYFLLVALSQFVPALRIGSSVAGSPTASRADSS